MDSKQKSYLIGGIIVISSPIIYLITRALYRRKQEEVENLKKELAEDNSQDSNDNLIFGKKFMNAKEGKIVFVYDRFGNKRFSHKQKEETAIGKKIGTKLVEIKYIQEGNHSLEEACTSIIRPYYKMYVFNSLVSLGFLILGSGQIISRYLFDKDFIILK